MKEMLKEIVAKAAAAPDSYPDLVVTYERGHELSGVTRFEMWAGTAFKLNSDNPRRQTAYAHEGRLRPEQRQAILQAMDDSFFEIPPSTRNLGDDEIPYTITLSYDDMSYQLEVWAADGQENPDFVRLQQALRKLFIELSDDRIKA